MANPSDDIFYVASLLEFTARKTKNRCKDVAISMGVKGIREQYRFANVSHCLSFEQASYEVVELYRIEDGNYAREDKASSPSYLAVGKAYANIVVQTEEFEEKYPDALYNLLCSQTGE